MLAKICNYVFLQLWSNSNNAEGLLLDWMIALCDEIQCHLVIESCWLQKFLIHTIPHQFSEIKWDWCQQRFDTKLMQKVWDWIPSPEVPSEMHWSSLSIKVNQKFLQPATLNYKMAFISKVQSSNPKAIENSYIDYWQYHCGHSVRFYQIQ